MYIKIKINFNYSEKGGNGHTISVNAFDGGKGVGFEIDPQEHNSVLDLKAQAVVQAKKLLSQ